jgi:TolB protein
MKLRLYLAILGAAMFLLGVSAFRGQVQPPVKTWRAIGALQPRLSPDGESIAFAWQGALWRVPRAGGVMRRLTVEPPWDAAPAWSPDGKKIAFLSAGLLLLLDAESGAVMPLPDRVTARGSLYFHPGGKKLLANCRAGNGFALSWVDLATGTATPALEPPAEARVFALSPDGASIAVVNTMDVPGEQGGYNGPQAEVWIVPAGGGARRKLVRFPSRIFDLAWHGTALVAVTDVGGAHNDLWEIPIESPQQARKLTFGQADEDAPSIAGSWLLYTDNREGATALVIRDLGTGDERIVPVSAIDYGKPTGGLSLEFVEKGTGRPLVVRVAIQEERGKPAAPTGALYRLHDGMLDFSADHEAELTVPAGRYHVHVSRGPEFRLAHPDVNVAAGRTTRLKVEMERWTDPPARGWYSGENHIHANYGYGQWYCTPDEMRRMVEAEGLNVANFVVANSDTDGIFDREFFRGRPDAASGPRNILYWNQEFRATLWGHMTLVNLKKLVEPIMTGFADTTNPWDTPTNSDIADHTHLQGGHVNYTHPAQNPADPYGTAYSAKSLPVDVALGKIDSIDINQQYEATVPLWHRLLNCGFRIPASGGTDCFLNRVQSGLPGASRVYVRIDGEFSYDAWIKNLKAGRTFVTNGPMLEFEAGGTVRLDGPGDIPVRAAATSLTAIERFEIVANGEVVGNGAVAADKLSSRIDQPVRFTKSGWLGVRVYAGGRQQAHSGAVYVEVAGKPAGSKSDADYFLSWIDRLEAQLKNRDRVPADALKKHVEEQLNAAREVYRRIAARE